MRSSLIDNAGEKAESPTVKDPLDLAGIGEAVDGFAVLWSDEYDEHEHGCYAVFDDRDAAVDYAVAMVFERAENLGVKPLDQTFGGKDDDMYEWTEEEVRDHLKCGNEMKLVLSRDELGFPFEYVSVEVVETKTVRIDKHYKYRGVKFRDLKDFDTVSFDGREYRTWTFAVDPEPAVTFAEMGLQDAIMAASGKGCDNGWTGAALDSKISYYVELDDDVATAIEDVLN